MNRMHWAQVAAVASFSLLVGCQGTGGTTDPSTLSKAERRELIDKMREATLERLYAEKPETKAIVRAGVGYAVFDATGVNVVLYVGGKGAGVLVDNATGKSTYMSMVRAGTGPGLGYKEFKQIIVFKSKGAMDLFLSAGVDVSASFDFGSVMATGSSFNPDFDLYSITDKGFTVQANWGGTKYFKDAELN